MKQGCVLLTLDYGHLKTSTLEAFIKRSNGVHISRMYLQVLTSKPQRAKTINFVLILQTRAVNKIILFWRIVSITNLSLSCERSI